MGKAAVGGWRLGVQDFCGIRHFLRNVANQAPSRPRLALQPSPFPFPLYPFPGPRYPFPLPLSPVPFPLSPFPFPLPH
jgi:hypothetical protein